MNSSFATPVNENKIKEVAEALKKNGMEAEIMESPEAALTRVKELIPDGASVMTGSSTTLQEIGFMDYLASGSHSWKDIHLEIQNEDDEKKRNDLRRKAVTADYFIASANAVTEQGQLLAADASGSRVGAFLFAAKHLILVVSSQKIVPDLDTGVKRIQEHVFPKEDKRAQEAYGIRSSINKWAAIEKEPIPGRVKVLLVEQPLGF